MAKILKLTESDLHKLIKESVTKILKEKFGGPDDSLEDLYPDSLGKEDDYDSNPLDKVKRKKEDGD